MTEVRNCYSQESLENNVTVHFCSNFDKKRSPSWGNCQRKQQLREWKRFRHLNFQATSDRRFAIKEEVKNTYNDNKKIPHKRFSEFLEYEMALKVSCIN